jgi:hypothetical protein
VVVGNQRLDESHRISGTEFFFDERVTQQDFFQRFVSAILVA